MISFRYVLVIRDEHLLLELENAWDYRFWRHTTQKGNVNNNWESLFLRTNFTLSWKWELCAIVWLTYSNDGDGCVIISKKSRSSDYCRSLCDLVLKDGVALLCWTHWRGCCSHFQRDQGLFNRKTQKKSVSQFGAELLSNDHTRMLHARTWCFYYEVKGNHMSLCGCKKLGWSGSLIWDIRK